MVKPYFRSKNAVIYHGDVGKILSQFPDKSINGIITDPPYPRQFLHLYHRMFIEIPRVCSDGASILAIVPHYALPKVLLEAMPYVNYRWLHCMWQPGASASMAAIGVGVRWKPIVWWINGKRRRFGVIAQDGFENRAKSKSRHVWEQHTDWADYCLQFVPKEKSTICDPFCGSGTLLIRGLRKGHMVVGIDNDEAACEIAAKRIERWLNRHD